jgi:hypothetical protein
LIRFIARTVKDGACVQFSYDGEEERVFEAPSSPELRGMIEREYGPIESIRKIGGGNWRGAMHVTFTSGRWVRLGKIGA